MAVIKHIDCKSHPSGGTSVLRLGRVEVGGGGEGHNIGVSRGAGHTD